jgi:glycosyltransferase involved in cell wall biosynthesis
LNILVFSWRGPGHPFAGGAEQATLTHIKGWIRAGYKVTLFTSWYVGGKREDQLEGLRIIRRGGQAFGVQFEALKWYLFEKKESFDLVIDEFHGIPFFTPLFVNSKKLAFIHEVTKEVWKFNLWPKPFNLIPYIFGGPLEPLIFKLIYSNIPFMTVSESTRADLIKWGIRPQNIKVIYNGLTTYTLAKVPVKEKSKTMIYLGAISKDKGIENALKTFSAINNKEQGWQFWVVGKSDPKYLKKLKSFSKELGIENKIRFWGFVNEKKKFELLSKSHIAINPSIREGWSLVNIEANSVGLPVLAYDVPGNRDSVRDGENGFLSPYGDYNSLASNAINLMQNKNLYIKIRIQAIAWSKNFSWKKATMESLALIEKVVRG